MQAREGECVYDWTAYAVFWSMTNKDDQPVLFEKLKKSNNIYIYIYKLKLKIEQL